MTLRGIKPLSVKKRLKALFYGVAGAGKTTCAINFPAVYLIDCEKGSHNDKYVEVLAKNGGNIFNTNDFDEVIKEVKSLLTEKHSFKTLVIDPFTPLYTDLLEKSEMKHGSEFGRHYNSANKQVKNLLNLLLRLDMNVIVTCHAKNEYGANLSVLGQTYDGYKKLDYLFDLVFEVQKRGKERVGFIKKSRVESFPDGEFFPFSYNEIAKRYSVEIIEKESIAEILATKEQVIQLNHLVELYKEPPELVQKWLDKAECVCFEDMNESIISKIIEHLENRAKK